MSRTDNRIKRMSLIYFSNKLSDSQSFIVPINQSFGRLCGHIYVFIINPVGQVEIEWTVMEVYQIDINNILDLYGYRYGVGIVCMFISFAQQFIGYA